MAADIIPLHAMLPRIANVSFNQGEPWRGLRLEMLLRHLWRLTLDLRGPESAARLPVFIGGLHDSEGNLRVDWRQREAMHALRPAVKFAWGVLDVGQFWPGVKVEHYYPGEWLTDEYEESEVFAFQRLRVGSYQDGIAAMQRALDAGSLDAALHMPLSFPVSKIFPARPDDGGGPYAA